MKDRGCKSQTVLIAQTLHTFDGETQLDSIRIGTIRGPLPSKGQRDWEKTNSGGDQASQNVVDTFSTRTRARAVFYRDQAPVIKRQNTAQWRRQQRRKHLSKRWCPLNGTMDIEHLLTKTNGRFHRKLRCFYKIYWDSLQN